MNRTPMVAFSHLVLVLSVLCPPATAILSAQEHGGTEWPRRVLITNDNGIDDPKIVALARAFATVAETWVLAPAENRSGSSHRLALSHQDQLVIAPRDLGPRIKAWAVSGYPGDCVLLGLFGLMREAPPDLVISGINGGANLAHDWLWSGTIGAARVAAFAGIPAIAVSGLRSDIPESIPAATGWVVDLARGPVARQLAPGDYLTVSIPRVSPAAVKGVRVARRADRGIEITFRPPGPGATDLIWTLETSPRDPASQPLSDLALYEEGYIVVVPMRADEHGETALSRSAEIERLLPPWHAGSDPGSDR